MFGGDWTEKKLNVLANYLKAYTTALKKQPFKKLYIDAFAGTGYRELKTDEDSPPLFEELAAEAPQKFLDGSARIALKTVPNFDQYIFIENSQKRVGELNKLKQDKAFNHIAEAIIIQQCESNKLLQDICKNTAWDQHRAVVFLDPFGMQVDWSTMKAIARTRAIDVWALFPLGMAVNRVLTADLSKMPPTWAKRLTMMFGNEDWKKLFYTENKSNMIFGEAESRMQKSCTLEQIGNYYHKRLKETFPAVAPNPATLLNSTRSPLYQLHFAAANKGNGGTIALTIAEHLLKGI